jgi:hypothetical protein
MKRPNSRKEVEAPCREEPRAHKPYREGKIYVKDSRKATNPADTDKKQ